MNAHLEHIRGDLYILRVYREGGFAERSPFCGVGTVLRSGCSACIMGFLCNGFNRGVYRAIRKTLHAHGIYHVNPVRGDGRRRHLR